MKCMEAYNWIDEFFIEKGHLFLKILNSRWDSAWKVVDDLVDFLRSYGIGKWARILDLGCGNGRFSIALASRGYRVIGIDISPIYIADAWRKAGIYGVLDRVSFQVGNVLDIDRFFPRGYFDSTLLIWTTIIGYYGSKEYDRRILEKIRNVTRDNGYLFILWTTNYDLISIRKSMCGLSNYIDDIDEEFVLVEKPSFDHVKAILESTWIFYRNRDRDLIYFDEVKIKLKLYTLHEIVELAEKSGWKLEAVYRSIKDKSPYKPGKSGFNIVFKAI